MNKIIDVTPENVMEEGLFCIKDPKNPGFELKKTWFTQRYAEGLRLKILKDPEGKQIAFIEYIPAEKAWRPVRANQYLFIQCMLLTAKKDRQKGNGNLLLDACESDARQLKKAGITVMTSKGSWIADKRLFDKNGFHQADQRGRFELMVKKLKPEAADPSLIDWKKNQAQYQGWHLLYADQCPWHEKSVLALQDAAREMGISLNVKKITSAEEAKNAPSGYGVFSLLHDGKLLEDHYLSQTRFRSIVKKELEG